VTTNIDRSCQAGQILGMLLMEQAIEGAVIPGAPLAGGVGFDAIDEYARMNGGLPQCGPQQLQDLQLLVELMSTAMLMRQLLGNANQSPALNNLLMRMMIAQSLGGGSRSPNGGLDAPGRWASRSAIPPWGEGPRSCAPWDGTGASPTGQRLAACAAGVGNNMCSVGRCYSGVKEAVRKATGVNLQGGSAYQAANQLAASGRFREVAVGSGQLGNLPAGAVVVWGQTAQSPHGHVSVALGNGLEASDHVQRQITSLRGHQNYRVFIPT
jgi:hypothetical protein